MTTENYITAICLIAAATILLVSFRLAYWRNRADRAEAALARVETVIANEHRSLRYYHARDALAGDPQ
jgi:hypothetical protein